MDNILFLGKKTIKDKYYFEVYFNGAVKLCEVNKDKFENNKFLTGQKMSLDYFDVSFYNKGYDTILNLKIK